MSQYTGTVRKGLRAIGSLGIAVVAAVAEHGEKSGHGLGLGAIGASLYYVLGHVFTHFGAELTTHLSHDVLERISKNPRLLNHDLQKLFSSSVQQAITEGVIASYEYERGKEIKLDKQLTAQLDALSSAFKQGFDITSENPISSAGLISFLSEKDTRKNYYNLFKGRVGREYNPDVFFDHHMFPPDFISYFEKNLLAVTRILFIEGLKSKHHEKALVAYEQMMAEETYKSLHDIKKDIASLKAAGSLPASTYARIPEQEFNVSVERLNSAMQLQPEFAKGIKQYFQYFDQKLDDLLELERDTNFKVSRIDVKTDRIEKGVNRGLVLSYFLVAIAIVGATSAYFYFRQTTFHATVELRDQANKALSQGTVAIEYGVKKEKVNLNSDGLAMFTQIPTHFEKDSVEVLLIDDLDKNYTLHPSSAKILLKPDDIIHIQVIKKSVVDTGTTTPAVNKPGSDTQKLVKDISKSALTDVSKVSDLNNQYAKAKELNGVTYEESTSPDNLTLTYIGRNILAFQGTIGIQPISGKMKLSGNSLSVTGENISGNLSLLNDGNVIKGSLTITSTNASHTVNMKKTN